MPRGPRLDAVGALHHVIGRGIERRDIFLDDHDRDSFVHRLARLVEDRALEVFAWALMPNHFHLLVRTCEAPLSIAMRRMLTGHAVFFNRRHWRAGHLFQNRYKSILCEEEAYFLELVRYIHLNPLRGVLVQSLGDLAHYPYTGHSALEGAIARPWQSSRSVLERFASQPEAAKALYRRFMSAADVRQRRPELVGGGLVRCVGGWQAVHALRRGREVFEADERILGRSEFVASVLRELARDGGQDRKATINLNDLVSRVSEISGLERSEWVSGSRRRVCSAARDGMAFLWIHRLGRSASSLARIFGLHVANVCRAAERGRRNARLWDTALKQRN
jgi:REP element-mobilizing transposase RayT